MSDLTFSSQPERSNFLMPAIIVIGIVGIAFALIWFFTPHDIAKITVSHIAVVPEHTVYKMGSNVVGAQDLAQDDLYVVATVHIVNDLKLPIQINDLTGTLSSNDGQDQTTSAMQKKDIPNLYVTFPALEPLGSAPLLRETEIQPGQQAEGMVMLHFPVTQQDWDQRKSASVNIDFYHQGTLSVTIPKP
jgi:hypothetical protein